MSKTPSVKEIFKTFKPTRGQAREMQRSSRASSLSDKARGDMQGYRTGKIQELEVKLERQKRIEKYQKTRTNKGTGRLGSGTLSGNPGGMAYLIKEIKRRLMKGVPGSKNKLN